VCSLGMLDMENYQNNSLSSQQLALLREIILAPCQAKIIVIKGVHINRKKIQLNSDSKHNICKITVTE